MIEASFVQRHYQAGPARGCLHVAPCGAGSGACAARRRCNCCGTGHSGRPVTGAVCATPPTCPEGGALELILPQVLGFRLVIATLTDAAFALPIWGALQVRNRLRSHAPIDPALPLELSASTGAWRALPKGCEIDVHLCADQSGLRRWEGISAFYYRGARMADAAQGEPPAAPVVEGPALARWCAARGGGWRFGGLTGDFHGVHWSDRYARAMGFAGAFHHPARALGQCLAQWQHRRGELSACSQALDVWIKGPVPYGATLELRASGEPQREGGAVLTLRHDADPRAALVARWWVPIPSVRIRPTSPR